MIIDAGKGKPALFEGLSLLGATVGFLVEYRYVRADPACSTRRQQAMKVALGLGGIAADRLAGSGMLVLGLFTAGTATLWAVLGVPYLFRQRGLSEQR